MSTKKQLCSSRVSPVDDEKKESGFSRAASRLSSDMSALENALRLLEDTLAPVISKEEREVKERAEALKDTVSDFTQLLFNISERLDTATERLQYLVRNSAV